MWMGEFVMKLYDFKGIYINFWSQSWIVKKPL